MSTKEHNELNDQMRVILKLTQRPGRIRAFLIGLIFPEFGDICGELANLCRMFKSP
jgi:hypothetical protein